MSAWLSELSWGGPVRAPTEPHFNGIGTLPRGFRPCLSGPEHHSLFLDKGGGRNEQPCSLYENENEAVCGEVNKEKQKD